jgi:hypothetical protein
MAQLPLSSSGAKMLKEHAVRHKDKTASLEIGHLLLRYENLPRPDKYLVFSSKTPAKNIYNDLADKYYTKTSYWPIKCRQGPETNKSKCEN